jgi:hypothetical protein
MNSIVGPPDSLSHLCQQLYDDDLYMVCGICLLLFSPGFISVATLWCTLLVMNLNVAWDRVVDYLLLSFLPS